MLTVDPYPMVYEIQQVVTQIYTNKTKPNAITQTFSSKRWQAEQIKMIEMERTQSKRRDQRNTSDPSHS